MTVKDMLDMQYQLYNEYAQSHHWLTYTPENAAMHWLYMLGEAGEVVDALKKHSLEELTSPGETRNHMVEEMADTMMFFMCTMACLGVTDEEFSYMYQKKHEKNMNRWK